MKLFGPASEFGDHGPAAHHKELPKPIFKTHGRRSELIGYGILGQREPSAHALIEGTTPLAGGQRIDLRIFINPGEVMLLECAAV